MHIPHDDVCFQRIFVKHAHGYALWPVCVNGHAALLQSLNAWAQTGGVCFGHSAQ